MFSGTFNLGGKKFPGNPAILRPWLQPSAVTPLIYAIGFQEVDMSVRALMVNETGRAQPWVDAVASVIGDQYELSYKQMVGLLLIIGLHKSITCAPANAMVEGFRACGVGLWNRGGNKGGVAATVRIYDTRILFCNLHLSANRTPDGPRKRNKDIYEVFSRISLSTPNTSSRGPTLFEIYQRDSKSGIEVLDHYISEDILGTPSVNQQYNFSDCMNSSPFDSHLNPNFPALLKGHDLVFVFGDLNYRLHTFETKPHIIMEHFLIDPETVRQTFLKIDQLSMQLRAVQDPSYIPTYLSEGGKINDESELDYDDDTYQDIAKCSSLASSPDTIAESDAESDEETGGEAPTILSNVKDRKYYEEYTAHPFKPCSYLYGFEEVPITFNPTYKILLPEATKTKKRGAGKLKKPNCNSDQQAPAPFCSVQLVPGSSLNLFDVLDTVSVESVADTTVPGSLDAIVNTTSVQSMISESYSLGDADSVSTVPKYEVDPEANKPRVPAYCDRVLFRAIAPGASINPTLYTSIPTINFSDHHPVCFLGTVTVRLLNQDSLNREQTRITNHLSIFAKELQPRYTLLTTALNLGRATYGVETAHSIRIRNDHPITSLNIVLDTNLTPPWIYLRPSYFTLKPMTTSEVLLHHRFRFFLDTSSSGQVAYIYKLLEQLTKPDDLSLVSFESQRAFVLRSIIEGRLSFQIFTVGLNFISGRTKAYAQNNVLATEKIQCTIDYTGLRDALLVKPLHDLVQRSGAMLPAHFMTIANYFDGFLRNDSHLVDNITSAISVDVFDAAKCIFKTKQVDDLLLNAYDILKSTTTDVLISDTTKRFAATVIPYLCDDSGKQILMPVLIPHSISVFNQPNRTFASIEDHREKERLYLLFYYLCIDGIETLKTGISHGIALTLLNDLSNVLKAELLSFKYYCMQSIFHLMGPVNDSNKLYEGLSSGFLSQIPQNTHPASVAELIVDFIFGLPEGIFPEYSYHIINGAIQGGVPNNLESLRKQATAIFYTSLTEDSSNLFLFLVSLFRHLLYSYKMQKHGFHLRIALRILAKLTFRSSEQAGRNKNDESYMLAFLGE